LRDNYPFGLFTVPKNELQRIHCSSGTTGKPTVVGYTKEDVDLFSEVVARSLNAAGAKPGMQLHNAYGYGIFTGGLGLHYGAEKLGMSVLPISGGMTARQVDLIMDFQPEVICCSPSYALTIADEFAKRGISAEEISLKYAVLGSEPWTELIRQHIEERLGVHATNIYGLSEIIGPEFRWKILRKKEVLTFGKTIFIPKFSIRLQKSPFRLEKKAFW
jgi:phenylacetate-CoA ligase